MKWKENGQRSERGGLCLGLGMQIPSSVYKGKVGSATRYRQQRVKFPFVRGEEIIEEKGSYY